MLLLLATPSREKIIENDKQKEMMISIWHKIKFKYKF